MLIRIFTNTDTEINTIKVIMNRVGKADWARYKTVSEVCAYTGFDTYGNNGYQDCMAYLNACDRSNAFYEQVIGEVIPIYNGEVADITGVPDLLHVCCYEPTR